MTDYVAIANSLLASSRRNLVKLAEGKRVVAFCTADGTQPPLVALGLATAGALATQKPDIPGISGQRRLSITSNGGVVAALLGTTTDATEAMIITGQIPLDAIAGTTGTSAPAGPTGPRQMPGGYGAYVGAGVGQVVTQTVGSGS